MLRKLRSDFGKREVRDLLLECNSETDALMGEAKMFTAMIGHFNS